MRTATVVGAGVFGSWTAWALERRGWRVSVVDAHGPANSRASSGGETRISRSGYGGIAIYARWARESLGDWLDLELRSGETLFTRTGALFLGRDPRWLDDTMMTLRAERIPAERLGSGELRDRYPQLDFAESAGAVLEPEAGVLYARRGVQTLVRILGRDGVAYTRRQVDAARELRHSTSDALVFACGPWLPSMFPEVLGDAIRPTRQEVFFFGAPPGDDRFTADRLPAWVAFDEGIYGVPDLEGRGAKVAMDAHGSVADPERMDRCVSQPSVDRMREILSRRLPALADAPLLESRVCQYENTADGHLLLDRLPGHDRAWIAGGGSGHGFKHGPAVGRYMADLIEERRAPDPMFALAGRPPRARAVY
jgi:sarcosine oxidase